MKIWTGPDGWTVEGITYKHGDALKEMSPENLEHFTARGFIGEVTESKAGSGPEGN